jgi:chromosome partitioning protein
VYRTIIPRNVRLAEAPSHGMPVIKYDTGSRGAIAYLALAAELVRRQKERAESAQAASRETSENDVSSPSDIPAA